MPRKGRGRRVAARQAQLGQKKKHGRGPSGIPTTTPHQASQLPAAASAAATTTAASAEPKPSLFRPRPVSTRRTEAGSQTLVYNYVGPELRRIATLSSAIIIVIVILSFVLT